MARRMVVAVAQLGPIGRAETRASAVRRMLALMREAKGRGAALVVFPELALTTFFPRWFFEDEHELDPFYETGVPNTATAPLFEAAAELEMGFYLGYAELDRSGPRPVRYNSSVLVDPAGRIVGKYRKVHLPGHADHEPWRPFQHLEKRYFAPGDLGFPVFEAMDGRVGMCICNDRRWPETWRVLGLRGAELVCLGYNTPTHRPPVPQHDHLNSFHHLLSLQAGAYQNGLWVAAAAKAGPEEGCMLLGHSAIVAPTGEIVAMSSTVEDELITAAVDLDRCREVRDHIFNFRLHRRPEHYGIITAAAP
jgi:N-carbamoyl-D-amino-acid hydrolase